MNPSERQWRLFPAENFWRLHLLGWLVFTLLNVGTGMLWRFPVRLTLLNGGFLFLGATTLYLLMRLLHQTRIGHWVIRLSNHLPSMLLLCTCVGAAMGVAWHAISFSDFIDNYSALYSRLGGGLAIDGSREHYAIDNIRNGIYIFCLWGVCWFTEKQAKVANKQPGMRRQIIMAIFFVVGLIFANALSNNWRGQHYLNWQHLAVSLSTRALLLATTLYWVISLFNAQSALRQRLSHWQLRTTILISFVALSMPASVLMDIINYQITTAVFPHSGKTRILDFSSMPITDLMRRATGLGRELSEQALLLSLVVISLFWSERASQAPHFPTLPRNPRFWINNTAAWLLLGAITLLLTNSPDVNLAWPAMVLTLCSIVVFGSLLSTVARLLILGHDWALFQPHRLIPRLSAIAVTMGAALVVIYDFLGAAFQDLYFTAEPFAGIYAGAGHSALGEESALFVLWFFLWSFVYSFFLAYQHKMELAADAWRLQNESKEAQLSLLSKQLDPHFIFNTLTCIRYAINENPEVAKNTLLRLTDLLRNNLTKTDHIKITLADEMLMVNGYLDLCAIQLEERLQWRQTIDEACLNCLIPPMLIQLTVENAIKHGISRSIEVGYIDLQVALVGNSLRISITNSIEINSNRGFKDPGIGIANIRQRLALMYAERASFNFELQPTLAIATVIIPVERSGE